MSYETLTCGACKAAVPLPNPGNVFDSAENEAAWKAHAATCAAWQKSEREGRAWARVREERDAVARALRGLEEAERASVSVADAAMRRSIKAAIRRAKARYEKLDAKLNA